MSFLLYGSIHVLLELISKDLIFLCNLSLQVTSTILVALLSVLNRLLVSDEIRA